MIRPDRGASGWAIGVLMTLGVVGSVGGWYEHRWYPPVLCANLKAGAVNVEGFEVVPGQTDPCYLRRSRIRPWQWSGVVGRSIRAIRGD